MSFTNAEALQKHVLNKHQRNICPICAVEVSSEGHLKQHIASKHDTPVPRWQPSQGKNVSFEMFQAMLQGNMIQQKRKIAAK